MNSNWTNRIRLRNLRFLLNLAQTHNLSHSAAQLHTTQPALSKWLKELEQDIGLTLFARHARGLTPTVHGRVLIGHARRIEAQLERAAADMQILSEGGAGHVVIGASGGAATEVGPLAVLEMAARMPELRIDLIEGTMDLLMEKLAQGDLDIALGRTVDASDHLPAFCTEILYSETVDLVTRRGHPLLQQAEIRWDDICTYQWIVWPAGAPTRKALEDALQAAGRSLPCNYIESNSVIANVTLLNNSNVIGTASHRSAKILSRMDMLRILPLALHGSGSVSMYWRKNELLPDSVAQALDCIRVAAKS
ncbi:LysR substrate-binding domain-containing protein [Castellaniella hirudinis]|uniref:LysR substrate-binding domain-containing protein n=1 Tax=Castellaniella hirudinis TaxID=1144617 RepID=UPI0039C2FE79